MSAIAKRIIICAMGLLLVCGCSTAMINAMQGNSAMSKYSTQYHSSAPDVSKYAVNVGSDPLMVFLYSALTNYPNGFANMASRPMTEQEKIQDDEVWEKHIENSLDSIAKTSPNLDRASLLRVIGENTQNKQVLLNPPPGSIQSLLYRRETLQDGTRILDFQTPAFRLVTDYVDLSFDGGASTEEAMVKVRQIFNSIRNLLDNDPKWTYKDDVWLNDFQQAFKTTAAGKRIAGKELPPSDAVGWVIDYKWESSTVSGYHDQLVFVVGTKKPTDSSRYCIYVTLFASLQKKPWDK